SHSLTGSGEIAQLPQPTIFNFVLNLSGDFFATKDFKGKLSLHARRVQLGLWLNNHIPNLEFTHGMGNVEVGASWDRGQLQELQSKFVAEDTGLKSKYLIQDLLINNTAGEFDWQRQDQGWNLAVTNSRLDSDSLVLPKMQFTLNSK